MWKKRLVRGVGAERIRRGLFLFINIFFRRCCKRRVFVLIIEKHGLTYLYLLSFSYICSVL